MPYIAQKDRPAIDEHVTYLAKTIQKIADEYGYPGAFAGLLNYAITTLALKLMPARRYWAIAIMTGVMVNVLLEFYRKYAVPYEDEQIAKNGDVY